METSTSEVLSIKGGEFKNQPENHTVDGGSKKDITDQNIM